MGLNLQSRNLWCMWMLPHRRPLLGYGLLPPRKHQEVSSKLVPTPIQQTSRPHKLPCHVPRPCPPSIACPRQRVAILCRILETVSKSAPPRSQPPGELALCPVCVPCRPQSQHFADPLPPRRTHAPPRAQTHPRNRQGSKSPQATRNEEILFVHLSPVTAYRPCNQGRDLPP